MRKKLYEYKFIKTMGALLLVFALGAGLIGLAQVSKERVRPGGGIKELEGQVVGINKRCIAVVYSRDRIKGSESEIMLPVDEETEVVHRRSLENINVGDTVRIQFEEETEERKGKQRMKRKARAVRFVRPASDDVLRSLER
ncbi:MAG: hypothetical protein JSW40_06495 [Candidatus Omnitrophota bacterium]|nr:MAG: hypothetical protein JSW40_06495 [Candidatus Omnitrophota bacterium]